MTDCEFELMLNELNDPVTVANFTFDFGTLIRKMDPIAFKQMKNECEDTIKPNDTASKFFLN